MDSPLSEGPFFSPTMILLTLLYLYVSSRTPTFALPTGHPSLPPAVHNFQLILSRENALNSSSNSRTIWNIIWSCFSTLFACAWIAIHPNIPAPGDSQWKILRRRMMIMTYVLLAPELVIMWAARQHHDAKMLVKKFQIEGRPGWTKTHAFFLIMGGFTLHAKGKPIRVLRWKDLKALVTAGRIVWPDITQDEIKDRSKGDYLSKGIVVLQTTWFIAQFIGRAASRLTITELEVITLAFSAIAGVIFYLWWDKPLDVRCSVPVHLVEGSTGQVTEDNVREDDLFPEDRCLCCLPPLDVSPTTLEGEEVAKGDQAGTDNLFMSSPPDSPLPLKDISSFNSVPMTTTDSPPSSQTDSSRESTLRVSWVKRFYFLIQSSCRKYGTFAGLVHVFMVLPFYFSRSHFYAMMNDCAFETDTQEPNDNPIDTLFHSGPLRVPTFYSYTIIPCDRFIFGICISVLFGAIHGIAWYYEFPSSPERWGWRISSIVISVAPLMLLLMFTAFWMGIVTQSSLIFSIFREVFSLSYICSRVALLILPLIALRALPPGAYVDLDWATIIPHI
jgi:hypothetical protein